MLHHRRDAPSFESGPSPGHERVDPGGSPEGALVVVSEGTLVVVPEGLSLLPSDVVGWGGSEDMTVFVTGVVKGAVTAP